MYGVHYYQIIKKSKDSFFIRVELVKYALENGIQSKAVECIMSSIKTRKGGEAIS